MMPNLGISGKPVQTRTSNRLSAKPFSVTLHGADFGVTWIRLTLIVKQATRNFEQHLGKLSPEENQVTGFVFVSIFFVHRLENVSLLTLITAWS